MPVSDCKRKMNIVCQIIIIIAQIFSTAFILSFENKRKYNNEKIEMFTSNANRIWLKNNAMSLISVIDRLKIPNKIAVLINELTVTELAKNNIIFFISFNFNGFEVPRIIGKTSRGNLIFNI